MQVSKEDFARLKKSMARDIAARELDIKTLVDIVQGFVELFGDEGNSEMDWALESLSDASLDLIAEKVAVASSTIDKINDIYLFTGE